jgi:MarR family transcriptional regulator, organic hydroperoxide resistance regulator
MKTSESKYAQCLYFTSNALARKMEKLAVESWKPAGLSPSHAYLLIMVLEDPGQQPGNLAQHLQLTPSTITRLLEKLEEKKLIVRNTEGKLTNVYPTQKSKQLLPILYNCVNHFRAACSKLQSENESSRMLTNMHNLAEKMKL